MDEGQGGGEAPTWMEESREGSPGEVTFPGKTRRVSGKEPGGAWAKPGGVSPRGRQGDAVGTGDAE